MRWWDSRLIHEPTASADAVLVKRSPMVAKVALVYRVERSRRGRIGTSQVESVRSSGGILSIPELTRCHEAMG